MTENNGRSFYDDDIDDEPLEETGPLAFVKRYWVALGIGTVVVGSLIFTGLGGGVSVPAETPTATAGGSVQSNDPLPSATTTAPVAPTSAPTATFTPEFTVTNGPNQAFTPPEWQPTAKAFASAWANPAEGKEAWLAGLKPYLDDSLYQDMENVDVNLVPIDTVVDVTELKNDHTGVVFSVSFANSDVRMKAYMQWDPAQSKWVVYQISR